MNNILWIYYTIYIYIRFFFEVKRLCRRYTKILTSRVTTDFSVVTHEWHHTYALEYWCILKFFKFVYSIFSYIIESPFPDRVIWIPGNSEELLELCHLCTRLIVLRVNRFCKNIRVYWRKKSVKNVLRPHELWTP